MMRATPSVADMVPSVTMKPLILRRATHSPLTSPTARPEPRPASTPSVIASPVWPGNAVPAQAMTLAATTLARAMIAPTDRSKPPAISTSACPQATTARKEALRRMFRMLTTP